MDFYSRLLTALLTGAHSIDTTADPPTSISACLKELITWTDVEVIDNYDNHVFKLLELFLLPTSGYTIQSIPALSLRDQQDLKEFEKLQKNPATAAQPVLMDEERRISNLNQTDACHEVLQEIARREGLTGPDMLLDPATAEERAPRFFYDCYGLKPRAQQQSDGTFKKPSDPEADAMGIRLKEVYDTLYHLRVFLNPDPDKDGKTYMDLFNDKGSQSILSRAMIRYQPEDDFKQNHVEAQHSGHEGDVIRSTSQAAAIKLESLRQFGNAIGLRVEDLLKNGTHFADDGDGGQPGQSVPVFAQAHNRIQIGAGTVDDKARLKKAAELAIKMGVKKIQIGTKSDSTFAFIIKHVLEGQCGMNVGTDRAQKTVGGKRCKVINSWTFEERAPGMAELMWLWCPELRQQLRAKDYERLVKEYHDKLAEQAYQAERTAAMGGHSPTEQPGGEDAALVVGVDRESDPQLDGVHVFYEPISCARLQGLLADWKESEAERTAVLKELEKLVAAHSAMPNVDREMDPQLGKMRDICSALRALVARHQILAELDSTMPPAAEGETVRWNRVEYETKTTDSGVGRMYPKSTGWWEGDKYRCATLSGMPADLRPALTGGYLLDIDGVKSDLNIYRLLMRDTDFPMDEKVRRTQQISRYLSDPDAWHREVARWYLAQLGQPGGEEGAAIPDDILDKVKRFPNILANGGTHVALMLKSVPTWHRDLHPHSLVVAMEQELKLLRIDLLHKNKDFTTAQTERLKRERPDKSPEEIKRTVFSLLAQTRENAILQISVDTVRRLVAQEPGGTDLSHKEKRAGALVFDGFMAMVPAAMRTEEGVERMITEIEAELKRKGHGGYRLAVKPNFGLQDQPVQSAERAMHALETAKRLYPACGRGA